MAEMKALVYQGPKNIEVTTAPIPVPEEGEVLIRVAYSGICGTDLNIYQGAHPRATAPLIMGHELSGTVAVEAPGFPKGTPVTVRPLISCGVCDPCKAGNDHVCQTLRLYGIDTAGCFASYIKVAADKVHPLAEGTDLRRAAFLEPLAVGVHAVKRSGVPEKSRVVVFGAGTIGLAVSAALKKMRACQVTVVELNSFRKKVAEQLGFSVIDAGDEVTAEILRKTGGKGADYVFDCAGHPAVSEVLARCVKVRGTIVTVAAYKKPAPIDLLAVMFKEITLLGVRVYESEDFDTAIGLLGDGLDVDPILTHVLPPGQVNDAFAMLLSGGDAVKVLFDFTDEGAV